MQDVPIGAWVLGRGADAGIVIPNPAVSRAHARLVVDGDGLTLEDLESANGTSLNAQPVVGVLPLRDGDVFELGGSQRFRARITAVAAEPQGEPAAEVGTGTVAIDRSWRTRLIATEDMVAMNLPFEMPSANALAAPPPLMNAPSAAARARDAVVDSPPSPKTTVASNQSSGAE